MTKLWILAAAFALAGCGIAYSPTPMFTAADADRSDRLKPGVWRNDEDCAGGQCKADAQSALITATTIEFFNREGSRDDKDASPWPYLIAHGPPALIQAKVQRVDDGQQDEVYAFAALEPLTRDSDGAITRARLWLVQCGAPDKRSSDSQATGPAQAANPLPGMTMVGSDCIPRDRAVLLDAATRSRGWAEELTTIYWTAAQP